MKTIVALTSAPFNCAAHLISISGDHVLKIVQKITKEKITKESFKIQKVHIIDKNKQQIDFVFLNKFVNKDSWNGEDMIEINCHGGMFVATKIIELLLANGATYAKRGEFCYPSVLNKKFNLVEANAINNPIKSANFTSLTIANNGLNDKTTNKIISLKESLFKIIWTIEVNIDYPEYEDYKQLTNGILLKKIEPMKKQINSLIKNSTISMKILEGFKIAIIGTPNVGKSSLLNKILNENKAIVSNIPGTTRDVVEGKINYKNITFNFIDTAGIRDKAKKNWKIWN